MKKTLYILRTLIFGGLFFLAPLILLGIIFSKAHALLRQLTDPLLGRFADITVLSFAVHEIVALAFLVLICFFAGLMSRTALARKVMDWIESSFLEVIPGYQFMKSMGQKIVGLEERDVDIVLARVDDGWQLSVLIEKVNDNLYTVYIPSAPNPWSGSVYHMEKDKLIFTKIHIRQAMHCLRQFGFGSIDLLKNGVDSGIPIKTDTGIKQQ